MTDNLPAVIPSADTDEPFAEPRRQDPIYQALSELGVTNLRVAYSGSGDSGCLNEIGAFDKNGKYVTLPDTPVPITLTHTNLDYAGGKWGTIITTEAATMPLNEAVGQWCYDLLEEHFGGWEINEGSDGTIEIDPAARTGTIEHTYYEPNFQSRTFT